MILFVIISCVKNEAEINFSKIKKIAKEKDSFTYKTGKLEKDETLANALMNDGLASGTAYKFVNQLDKIFSLRYAQPNDQYCVKLDTLSEVVEIAFQPNEVHTYWVFRDSARNFTTKIDTLQLVKKNGFCEGKIESSLWNAMVNAGEKPALIMMLTQIFQWDIDFFIDPQKGDKFKLIFEKYTNANDGFVKYGKILVANYESKKIDETAYFFKTKDGTEKYYDENGKCFQKAFLKSPLNYKRITSTFGSRYHPIRKKSIFHNGVDYAASYGTPVEAAADGTVIHCGWKGGHPTVNGRKGGYGKTVMVRHSNGYKTLYGHLSKYGKYKVGSRVSQHDVIGYVGSTGLSTGNHLHYTIYHHDKAINPLKLKNVSGPPIPKSEMKEFKSVTDSLKIMLKK